MMIMISIVTKLESVVTKLELMMMMMMMMITRYIQLITQYQHASGGYRMRVTTIMGILPYLTLSSLIPNP